MDFGNIFYDTILNVKSIFKDNLKHVVFKDYFLCAIFKIFQDFVRITLKDHTTKRQFFEIFLGTSEASGI